MTWTVTLTATVEALRGRLRQTLRDLAHAPPEGQDAIIAWSAVEKLLGLGDRLDPVLAARTAVPGLDAAMGGALAGVVDALAAAVDRALDAGLNDPGDPIFRPARLQLNKAMSGAMAGWRLLYLEGYAAEWPLSFPALPANHPLRSITPVRGSHGAAILIDQPDSGEQRFIRKSVIAARTAQFAAIQFQQDREALRRRDASRAAAELEAQRLERAAKELRGVGA